MFNHRSRKRLQKKEVPPCGVRPSRDVAALAGVSPATVSRALDDRPEIRPETRERVREACRQLGYVPNAAAKGLAGQATPVLGVVVPDVSQSLLRGHRQRHRGDGGGERLPGAAEQLPPGGGAGAPGHREFCGPPDRRGVISALSRETQARQAPLLEGIAQRLSGGQPRRGLQLMWRRTMSGAPGWPPGICWTWATGTCVPGRAR